MCVSASQFTERRLTQDDCSSFPQLLGNQGVSVRIVILKKDRAERRRHSFHIHLILDDDWNTMKGTGKAGRLESRIQPIRLFKRLGIDRDDRIDGGPLLLIRIDPLEIKLHQLMRRQSSGLVAS